MLKQNGKQNTKAKSEGRNRMSLNAIEREKRRGRSAAMDPKKLKTRLSVAQAGRWETQTEKTAIIQKTHHNIMQYGTGSTTVQVDYRGIDMLTPARPGRFVVIRGHPGYIPGFAMWMWILRRVFRIRLAAENTTHNSSSLTALLSFAAGLPAGSFWPGSAWLVYSSLG